MACRVMRAILPIALCTNGYAALIGAPPVCRRRNVGQRPAAAAKKQVMIICARTEPQGWFGVAPWALPRVQTGSRQTKLGQLANGLRLIGKGFVKCFSTLSAFYAQVACSPSPIQARLPPSAKTYVRSSI